MGIVHASRGKLNPASEQLKSEPAIIVELAKATFKDKASSKWDQWIGNYDLIRDAIEQTIPGFENYNKRVRQDGGFYLPNGAREGQFYTSTGKAHFTINPVPENKLEKGEYRMMTIRSHDQFNTTIYGLDDRYRGIYNGRRVVMMNPKDITEAGFKAGEYVDLIGNYEGEVRIAPHFMIVSFDIPARCVATYFPEANVLVPLNSYADRSHTPASKLVVITLRASKSVATN